MANVKDIFLDDNFNIVIKDGDFYIHDSDRNHQALIINSNVGAFYESPLVGVGIEKYLGSSGSEQLLKREIQVQLEADNYKVNDIVIGRTNDNRYSFTVKAQRILS